MPGTWHQLHWGVASTVWDLAYPARRRRVLPIYSQQGGILLCGILRKSHSQGPFMVIDDAVMDAHANDFPALEEKILKTIELVKAARAAQAAAERDADRLREQ